MLLLIERFNLIAVGAAAVLTRLFGRHHLWILPVAAGYGYLAYWHSRLDLASDAQAAIGVFIIPLFSLKYFAGGALAAAALQYLIARRTTHRSS